MKPGHYVLVNLLVVGAALFAYDTLRAAPTPGAGPATGQDLLTADRPAGEDEREAEERILMLDGGGAETLAQRNASEIAALRAEIRRLRSAGSGAAGEADRPPLTPTDPLPTLDPRDVMDENDPNFDEKTLKTIEAYVDEINRRKSEERQRARLELEFERQGLTLSDEQKKAVVDATLQYQERARDVLRSGFPRDEKGREDRRQAFEALQEEYKVVINQLVPAADAEKITNSRFARGLGFFGGGDNLPAGRAAPGSRGR
jgi:hypothetical protein